MKDKIERKLTIYNRTTNKQLVVDDLINGFLRNKDITPETRHSYTIALQYLKKYLSRREIIHPIPEDMIDFRDEYLMGLDIEPRTRALYFYSVKSFFSFLEQFNVYPNITKYVRGYRRSEFHARGWLTPAQLRKLLDAIDRKTLQDYRDYAMINFLARTGLRAIELVRADARDLQIRDGVRVLLVQGKGRQVKDELVVVTDPTWTPVLEYHQRRGEVKLEDPIFASHSRRTLNARLSTRTVRHLCRERFIKADIDVANVSAHSLRHSAATIALNHGAQLREVQAMMRHKDINTTKIYLNDIERLKNPAEGKINF